MKIKLDETVISQQTKSALKIKRSADCFFQKFNKFSEVGIFHNYEELIHAALLEANPKIETFVPQPIKLMVGTRRYIPDCYFVKGDKEVIVELKPRGEMDQKLFVPVEAYLKKKGYEFKVLSNEKVLEQEMLGLNWLQIIRFINSGDGYCTKNRELKILDTFYENPKSTIGEIIQQGNRYKKLENELALYRLIHAHKLNIHASDEYINYETEVKLCQ